MGPRSTLTLLLLFSIPGFAQEGWTPFFEPRVRQPDLLRQLAQMTGKNASVHEYLGSGGNGRVEAVARRRGGQAEVLSLKFFADPSEAKAAVRALQEVKKLALAGDLGELKVMEVYGQSKNQIAAQLIEGQPLIDLIRNHPNDPRVLRLYRRYQNILAIARERLTLRGYELLERVADPVEKCAEILTQKFGRSERRFRAAVLVASQQDLVRFGIDAENIVVDWTTGDFFLVDPY